VLSVCQFVFSTRMTRISLIFTDWYLSVIIRSIRVICVPMFLARG
jgi:hypothetical protein